MGIEERDEQNLGSREVGGWMDKMETILQWRKNEQEREQRKRPETQTKGQSHSDHYFYTDLHWVLNTC